MINNTLFNEATKVGFSRPVGRMLTGMAAWTGKEDEVHGIVRETKNLRDVSWMRGFSTGAIVGVVTVFTVVALVTKGIL